MSKRLYQFFILFLGLTAACNLLQGIALMWLGNKLFTQDYFIAWFFIRNIVSYTGAFFTIKYYRYRNYRAAFNTLSIATGTGLFYSMIYFMLLLGGTVKSYYLPSLILSLLAGIVYAFTLVFSETGKRIWLRAAGCLMLILGLITLGSIVWSLSVREVWVDMLLEKVSRCIIIASSFVFVFFMVHLQGEIKVLKAKNIE